MFSRENVRTALQHLGRNFGGQIREELLLLERFAGREILWQRLSDQQDQRIFRLRQKLKKIGGINARRLNLAFRGAQIQFRSGAGFEAALDQIVGGLNCFQCLLRDAFSFPQSQLS